MASVGNIVGGYLEGRAIKSSKGAEAAQMRRAATAKKAEGSRQAYDMREAGERVMSDARAAMAAGGGTTDIKQLADIKETTDYNVLSTIFAAEEEASQLEYGATVKEHEGKMAKRMGTFKALTGIAGLVGLGLASGGSGGGSE